jgi:probable F420-dependent oxidoreductase
MQFWQSLSFTEPEHLLELARIAEQAGFTGVLVSDHLFHPQRFEAAYPYTADGLPPFTPETPWPDPFVTIGAMAGATTRLRFSMAIYILPLRHPLEVAKAAATVAVLSGGRFALGCGAGWMKEEFTQLGVDFHTRGRRYDESIEVLRKVWAGGMVEHHGRFFDFEPLRMEPVPPAPLPIWIGGASRAALQRAARLGDGWIGAGEEPGAVPGFLSQLSDMRREYGRSQEPFDAIVPLTRPVEVDELRRLEEAGMTGTVNYPLAFSLGPGATLAAKREALERYAERCIVPMS